MIQLPDQLPDAIALALRSVSDDHINRSWRTRSNVTHYEWVDLARYATGPHPILELWDIASCLYAACATRTIGGNHFQGGEVSPRGWQCIAAILRDFLSMSSKPEHAMSRHEWEELHPRTGGTKGRRL